MKKIFTLILVLYSVILYGNNFHGSILYIFPNNNATGVRPQSSIIIKLKKNSLSGLLPADFNFDVRGSKSRKINGIVKIISNTIIFRPLKPFRTSEKVEVSFSSVKMGLTNLVFLFYTSNISELTPRQNAGNFEMQNGNNPATGKQTVNKLETEPNIINGVAVPSDFPILNPIIFDSAAAYGGKIFISIQEDADPYLIIYENDGTPYFYRRVIRRTRDFKLQPTGQLSRMITAPDGESGGWEILDSNYNSLGVYKAKNGYLTDDHEFVLTKAGTYILIVRDYRTIDTVEYRGNHIQEVDLATGEVVFQWNSWDHLSISDAYYGGADYVHMNSIAVDYDSNLVISCRHMSQCLKINRTTGEIIWKLGGKRNQFQFINEDTVFAKQHDIQPVPGSPNHYTIFDNGNGTFSRGVEYKLDLQNMTAEKVWQYRATPDRRTGFMGNVQRLPNGNSLINWANAGFPKPTEVTPGGNVVYEAKFSIPSLVYRIFKFDWKGVLPEPYLIAESSAKTVRLIFNKFGDTSVVSYNIYGDPFENPTSLVANTSKTWFDIKTNSLINNINYYFRVKAINSAGQESPFSNSEVVFVNYIDSVSNFAILGNSKNADDFDPQWVNDTTVFNSSLLFDGVNDYVNCGVNTGFQISGKNITLEARIKINSGGNFPYGYIIAKEESLGVNGYKGYALKIGNNNKITFKLGGMQKIELTTAENTFATNQWFHIAATYDGIAMKIFVNGVEQARKEASFDLLPSENKPLLVGNSLESSDNAFKGYIDEVRVWNITRTQDELTANMNKPLNVHNFNKEGSGLVGYWRLDENGGQTTVNAAVSNNLVKNGDFYNSNDYWFFSTQGNSDAVWNVDNHFYVNIFNGGSTESDVSLSQNNIPLTNGIRYKLEFDAWAESGKFIDVKVRQFNSPFTDYSRIGAVYITPTEQHYSYSFEMNNISDASSQLIFMIGGNDIDMYFDNISLTQDEFISDVNTTPKLANRFELFDNYPNPFNPVTTIKYTIPTPLNPHFAKRGNTRGVFITLKVYDILGSEVTTLVNKQQAPGTYKVTFNASSLPSGIYFYRLKTPTNIQTKKMVLLK